MVISSVLADELQTETNNLAQWDIDIEQGKEILSSLDKSAWDIGDQVNKVLARAYKGENTLEAFRKETHASSTRFLYDRAQTARFFTQDMRDVFDFETEQRVLTFTHFRTAQRWAQKACTDNLEDAQQYALSKLNEWVDSDEIITPTRAIALYHEWRLKEQEKANGGEIAPPREIEGIALVRNGRIQLPDGLKVPDDVTEIQFILRFK